MQSLPHRTLLASTLAALISACASNPVGQTEAGGIRISGTEPGEVLRPVKTDAPLRKAEIILDEGEYILTLGNPTGEATPAQWFRKLPLADDNSGRFRLNVEAPAQFLIVVNDAEHSLRIVRKTLPRQVEQAAANAAAQPKGPCTPDLTPQTITVGEVFQDGEVIRDALSGQTARVENGRITLTPAADSEGLMLLEAAESRPAPFRWDNATVYFALTDRFYNGNPDNDRSYGRQPDGKDEIGTFHGGDFAGLTAKLDYLRALGVNALWISPPFEQMHGWVGGGSRGDFQHYAYHGYYIMDFTRLDANFGTESELRTLVQEAHKRGIRILLDVVMNHPGYATLQDMQDYGFGGLFDGFERYLPPRWGDWRPSAGENFHSYHAMINYDHPGWSRWWGKDWVRAGIYDYERPPSVNADPVRCSMAYLPDFRTESTRPVGIPAFLRNKPDTRARDLPDATVRDYLITWLTDWVREYGIDGFRVDTAKHVELPAWQALKTAAQQALDDYRRAHPEDTFSQAPFWMVGEVFPHGVQRDTYFENGFDALINFDFQRGPAKSGAECLSRLEDTWNNWSRRLREDRFNVMSYISSHDTELFTRLTGGDPTLQKRVAAALLLTPGAVQIYYGDESARQRGPSGSDPSQGTRSDMNWADLEKPAYQALLRYWQTVGQFRQRHPAVGAGEQRVLARAPWTVSRTLGDDRIIIVAAQKP